LHSEESATGKFLHRETDGTRRDYPARTVRIASEPLLRPDDPLVSFDSVTLGACGIEVSGCQCASTIRSRERTFSHECDKMKHSFSAGSCGRLAILLLVVLGITAPVLARRKDDVVVMKNGDRFTGEIKGLQHGELSFKAGYMKESVALNWQDVAFVASADRFIVTLTSGERFTGVLETANIPNEKIGEIQLDVAGKQITVPQRDVIGLKERETGFWSQLNGSADLGFTYTSGNNSSDMSAAAEARYDTHKYMAGLSTTAQFSRSPEQSTNRYTLTNQNTRMLTRKWFVGSYIDLLKSDQQKLDLRSTWGGGLGQYIYQSPTTSLTAMFGGVYTHERYFESVSGEPVRNNGDVLLGLKFSTFRFKTTEVTSTVGAFPGMTDPGRLRIGTQTSLKFELVKDLYLGIRLYENFDSKPPVNAPRNDLGITTSLGWKF